MQINIQPTLENDQILLLPLEKNDFEALYSVASDSKIWEQHPNKNRWQRDVFLNFFQGAIESNGAYKIIDKTTGNIAGSTRIYGFDEQENSIMIGYTFIATAYWGKGFNPAVKTMLLNYLFQHVSQVLFQIGSNNIRSQTAITRLGATKIDEQEVAYFGEPSGLNFIYSIKKEDWIK
jgi:RimJ/RimL family protein N-acetyltransferase